MAATPRLLKIYREKITPEMVKKFGYKNSMQVPRLDKIVINMGVGKGAEDIKILEKAMKELSIIAGQKPVICRAKKAIANFKIKQGNPIGCKVTLRRAMMYEFLDRFINVAIPRIKDFQGVSPDAFDQDGNFSVGVTEQTIFPEINYDEVDRIQGMDISIGIKGSSKEESFELLRLFGMPFRAKGTV